MTLIEDVEKLLEFSRRDAKIRLSPSEIDQQHTIKTRINQLSYWMEHFKND